MKLSPYQESVLKAIQKIEVVDAHEHLPPEKARLDQKVDFFTLFSAYTRIDLLACGMPQEYWDKIHDSSISIEKRWEMFAPYFKNIRYGSYARPAFIAAKEIYGFNDINEKNYKDISEKVATENTPGIYNRILREKCRIRMVLTQNYMFPNYTDYDSDLMRPVMPLDTYAAIQSKKTVEEHALNLGGKVETLDDYLELIRKGMEKWKSEGVVGVKMASWAYGTPERSEAVALFDKLMRSDGKVLPELKLYPEVNMLYNYLVEEMLDIAAELGLVVAVHTGMWAPDPRYVDPQHMIPVLSRHLETCFDIFHMGIPWFRETALMGKNFPNVWLNLCWVPIISPRIACSAMDELIDLVPVNKIIAFGGDYNIAVEKTYGHLVMARENVAKVLGSRVEEGLITENEAIEIAKMWFYDNPKKLYQLRI